QYLAIHSPVFAKIFFGDSAQKGKEEVKIKGVAYEEFVELLNMIYPGCSPISATSLPRIMKLTDRFRMKDALRKAHLFLDSNADVDEDKKLLFSTPFNMLKRMMADTPKLFSARSQFSNVI
ncbi:hypothetical protein PMAYCL1PPCAC_25680, partial [Pristionchus mayeri]